MKKPLAITGLIFLLIIAYFLLWPVPVEPVAWQAPLDRGYVDPFASNDLLSAASGIDLGAFESPEDAALGRDGRVYVSTESGAILRLQGHVAEVFADAGGRPLGIEVDRDGSLLVANAYVGLQRITPAGRVTNILTSVEDEPLVYTNNLGIGPDGTIYFSQSSSKFGAQKYRGSYDASLLDILEHGGHGRVFAFDPGTRNLQTLMDDLNFPNGVAVSDDGRFILVAESGHYRILKHWLEGERRGQTDVLIDNLPAFPDNIKKGLNGRFWIGLVAPRNAIVDRLSDNPLLRKVVQRLPAALRPQAEPVSHVIAINGDGDVLMNLHDRRHRFPALTGVLETRDTLFLTSLFGNRLAEIAKRDL